MKSHVTRGFALLLLGALAACSSTGGGTGSAGAVDVGRFHLGETTIARAQIAIEPFDQADEARPEFAAYSAAVGRELTRLGWTVVPTPGQSEQVAMIDVEQGSREAIAALSAARVGRGVSGTAPTGSSAGIVATLLEVAIRRRSEGTVFWEGRAVAEARAGASGASAAANADRLAGALFRDFPGESGRIIRVK